MSYEKSLNSSNDRVNKRSTGKRKYHKKSRKGCATCKKRKVKCDEARPMCNNCDRMGIECVYTIPLLNQHENDQNQQDQEEEMEMEDEDELAGSHHYHAKQENHMLQHDLREQHHPQNHQIHQQHQQQQKYTQHQHQQPLRKNQQNGYSQSSISHQGVNMSGQTTSIKQEMPSLIPPGVSALTAAVAAAAAAAVGPSDNSNGSGNSSGNFQAQHHEQRSEPNMLPNIIDDAPPSARSSLPISFDTNQQLNMLDLRLMYHYTTKVWPTITEAGISDSKIWSEDIPMLAFKYPFLMHSVLAFAATHLSRTERGLDQCVTCHRADALRLLREAVLEMSPDNTDALVAAALILIMDSLANASLPTSTSLKSLPPSAWIFHVKGAATILTAVWPLSEKSRFYKFISVDLGDLGDIEYDLISGELSNAANSGSKSGNSSNSASAGSSSTVPKPGFDPQTMANMANTTDSKQKYSSMQCFDDEISDMFPLPYTSPYLPTLAYMAKLHIERNKNDFILRVFAFPALLDKTFLGLLIHCDLNAMRIMRCYYKLLRNFTEEMKERVWFLEGVSSVLPVDVEEYSGGGGMHMMLDFLGGPSTMGDQGMNPAASIVQSGLLDTNNLPSSSITDSLGLRDSSGLEEDDDAAFMGV